MKRKDRVSAPARCCCSANGVTIDERGQFSHVRIKDRISEYALAFRRALGREAYRERSLGWMISRTILVLVAIVAMLVLLELGKTTEFELEMPRSERINALTTTDRNSMYDSNYDPRVQSIRQYFNQ